MKANEAVKEYLAQYGWQYKGNCNCNGTRTNKFELKTIDGEYKIKYRPNNFSISTPTEPYKKYSIQELKPIVDEIFKKHIQAQA